MMKIYLNICVELNVNFNTMAEQSNTIIQNKSKTISSYKNKSYLEIKKKHVERTNNSATFDSIDNELGGTKNEAMLKTLHDFFYKNKKRYDPFIAIISDESHISRRVLDWFVTNYAKKNNIVYNIRDELGNKTAFQIYLEYKAQLKSYGKQKFDPFCRHKRIVFKYDHKKKILTTLGQLNFFMWAIKHKVIHYVEKNYTNIVEDMKFAAKKNKLIEKKVIEDDDGTTTSARRKRHELSVSAIKTLHRDDMAVVIRFE